MTERFCITEIQNILYVPSGSFKESNVTFSNNIKCNELIFMISGETEVALGEHTCKVKSGNLEFIPKGIYSKYEVKHADRCHCYDIFFVTDKPLFQKLTVCTATADSKCAVLFKRFYHFWIRREKGYYIKCMSILYELLNYLLDDNYFPKHKNEKIEPAVAYISEHFSEKIEGEHLARLCGISYAYLKKLFYQKYRLSPRQYLVNLRMSRAGEMLSSDFFSVSEISEQCGFSDITFFSRQFKNHYGVSPREYRKQLHGISEQSSKT
ncbi:MAG: helix-turn-helix transcriptional regulator [Clostridia bacterium]|nr:helix-turn-helix transcriptional regulator [Clostridia bacterium]